MSKSPGRSARLSRMIDLTLYVLIAVVVVASAGLYGVYQAKTGQKAGLPIKWVGFAVLTVIIFGYVLFDNRTFWHRPLFWGIVLVVLVVHLGLGLLLRQFDTIPLLVLAMAASIELTGLQICMQSILRHTTNDGYQ